MSKTIPPTVPATPATAVLSPEASVREGRPKFRRILLKLSGEAFCKPGGFGVDTDELASIAREIFDAANVGAQLAIVVGGGNIVRGAELASAGHIHQATADYMGMLGTVINGLALKEKLVTLGMDCRVMTAIDIRSVAEPFVRGRALRHLDKGRVVILVAGTGNPFFTTDTCAALRAVELECDVLLKATKVDGVYTADPRKDPTATKYESVTFSEAISKNLRIMDTAALAMCQEKNVPILVFDFKRSGNIRRVAQGESIGTLVRR
ncbi:MAG: UMP kinase [Phycisphaeraceae bacterium]|nr:UMP kinase [Phycisphaerae bacterium]MBX3392789.1 UMP kinase [Phycisphaeraceae bacterium]